MSAMPLGVPRPAVLSQPFTATSELSWPRTRTFLPETVLNAIGFAGFLTSVKPTWPTLESVGLAKPIATDRFCCAKAWYAANSGHDSDVPPITNSVYAGDSDWQCPSVSARGW